MQLPIITSSLSSLVTHWKSILDPILKGPMTGVSVISEVKLGVGVNVINHGLGQTQQGWFLTDLQGSAVVYRSAPFNSKTLQLTSSAIVTVSIGVF